MENTEQKPKKKGGKPKLPPRLKKKSCNIILNENEIYILEYLASAYGLNKSSFIATFLKRFAPHLTKFFECPNRMSKEDRQLVRLFNEKMDITPSRENVTLYNPRSDYISKAKSINRETFRGYEDALEENKELREEIINLHGDIKVLEKEIEDKDRNRSYELDQHIKTMDRANKLIDDLQKRLKEKK